MQTLATIIDTHYFTAKLLHCWTALIKPPVKSTGSKIRRPDFPSCFSFCSVQFSSVTQSCPTLCDTIDCSTEGLPVHHQLKLMSIESAMPSNHLILCRPLLLLPSIFPSIRVFSNQSVLRSRWPNYWHFSFNISPSNAYSGLISFKMDWVDLLAVQGTLKSPPTPKFKSINSLVLSFLYSPTLTSIDDHWKNHSLD